MARRRCSAARCTRPTLRIEDAGTHRNLCEVSVLMLLDKEDIEVFE